MREPIYINSEHKKTLWLGNHSRSRHQLSFEFGIDDLRFHASYWYADIDFFQLEEKYGRETMERIYFHIAAFTSNTLVSLQPQRFDPGPYSRFCTASFWRLWNQIIRGVWGQWRYENNLPDYTGPSLAIPLNENDLVQPALVEPGDTPVLAFCGGGKDSLVSIKLLQGSSIDFDTLVYSNSIYGTPDTQHQLCDSLLDAADVAEATRKKIWSFDDLTTSPVLRLYPEYQTLGITAAETPLSIFTALPLVLQHGYTYLCLGHERSADTGNLFWKETGEEINHQWGKSSEAEHLLNSYIRKNLTGNCNYFSILKPIYDVLIFNLLAQDLQAAAYAHSCNVKKPWCGKCPKCAYIWINYMAYFPKAVVQQIFQGHGNLLNAPETQIPFRQMLGLESQTPFECIGQIDEVRLAFEFCYRKGIQGAAMQTYLRESPPVDIEATLERYLQVFDSDSLPDFLKEPVMKQMRLAAEQALERFAAVAVPI